MKNLEKLEKLTVMLGRGYDENMENDLEKKTTEASSNNPQRKEALNPQILGKKIIEPEALDKNEDKPTPEKEKGFKDERQAVETAKMIVERDKIEKETREGKGSGLLDLFLKFLMSLFGVKEIGDAEKILEKSEAMRGVMAYMRTRPKNIWRGEDYARVIFMLRLDESREAKILEKTFRDEVRGETEKAYLRKWIELERASIARSEERAKGGRVEKEKVWDRVVWTHADLWEEMKMSGELRKLNPKQRGFLTMMAGKVSGGSGLKGEGDEIEEGISRDEDNEVRRKPREEWLKEIAKNTERVPEIADTAKLMLTELREINASLGMLVATYMDTIIENPEEIARNPQRYKKMQHTYISQRTRELDLETQLEQLIGGEKKILGGERDQELYVGKIDKALKARMDRIEYFIKYKRKKFDETDPDKAKSGEDRVFRKKMQKIYKEFEGEGTLVKHEELYFKELQRWVGTILKNTDLENGELQMPTDVYKKFKEIKDKKMDPSSPSFENDLLGVINDLKSDEWKFLDYFRPRDENGQAQGRSYLNFAGKGMNPVSHEIVGSGGYGYPHSLEATMMLIANDWGPEWRTGGDYELIDAEGKFHKNNFLLWMRRAINKQIDWDPISPIDPQRGITFKAGFSQLTLFDILYLPQYTQHQEYKMSGDVRSWYSKQRTVEHEQIAGKASADAAPPVEERNGSFQSDWGDSAEHPDMPYGIAADDMLVEAWQVGAEHNDYVKLNQLSARGDAAAWVKEQGEIAQYNNYTRAGLAFRPLMLASHKGNETEDYYNKKRQGSLGQAVNTGRLFYRYLAEFTEFYVKREKSGRVKEVNKENMAYKVLGYDGASIFLMSLAETSFDQADLAVRKQVKEAYRKFILERVNDVENDYKGKGLDEKKIAVLVDNYRESIRNMKQEDLKIGLDSFDKLTKLKLDIESKVMGKRIVDEEEKRKYELKTDRTVVREEAEMEIGRKMRKKIGDFFEGIVNLEIPYVPEKKNGEKERIERDKQGNVVKRVKIGDLEVFVDRGDRIVKKGEADEIWGAGMGKKKSVREIMEEFSKNDNFVEEGEVLENFRKALREYEKDESADNKRRLEGLYGKCEKIFERRERLGLALLTKVANVPRDELNMFKRTRTFGGTSTGDIPMMKYALKKTLTRIYGLNETEGDYAYNRVWYPLDRMEIAGFNNTSGVPGYIQQGSNYSRTMEMRRARMSMGKFGGSEGTLTELIALRLPTFFERIRVSKPGEGLDEHMLIEILQGGQGINIKHRWERKLDDNPGEIYRIRGNAEHTDFGDGLRKAEDLRKIIVEDLDMQFGQLVYMDQWGVMKVRHEKAIKLFDTWWNKIRLVYNSHGIDFNSKIAVDGREVSALEHLFGKDIRGTLDRVEDYYKELADKKGKDAEYYGELAAKIRQQPAMAVFLDMATAAIHEHREVGGTYNQWTSETISEIWWVMDHYLHERSPIETHGNVHKDTSRPSVIPYELFNRILGVHHGDSMEKFLFWDLYWTLFAGLIKGIGGAWKEAKDEIVPVSKTYTQPS